LLIVRSTTRRYDGFGAPSFIDFDARGYFSFQAWATSPAMGMQTEGPSSMYSMYLAAYRDSTGALLDGGKTYKLTIPQPVPADHFWSRPSTTWIAALRSRLCRTRPWLSSRVQLPAQSRSLARSLLRPTAPVGKEAQWVKTIPGKGWFNYFRIYGPQAAAFDGRWKLPDIELVYVQVANARSDR